MVYINSDFGQIGPFRWLNTISCSLDPMLSRYSITFWGGCNWGFWRTRVQVVVNDPETGPRLPSTRNTGDHS